MIESIKPDVIKAGVTCALNNKWRGDRPMTRAWAASASARNDDWYINAVMSSFLLACEGSIKSAYPVAAAMARKPAQKQLS